MPKGTMGKERDWGRKVNTGLHAGKRHRYAFQDWAASSGTGQCKGPVHRLCARGGSEKLEQPSAS